MSRFKITQLRNGAQVLALKELDEGYSIVLAKPANNKNEFVTWLVNTNYEAVAGHYFPKLPSAIQDYNQRR